LLEHAQVPRRGRPGVLEARRQLARRRGITSKVQCQQDLPARRVGDRIQDLVECD
jgi:hypothetical protein